MVLVLVVLVLVVVIIIIHEAAAAALPASPKRRMNEARLSHLPFWGPSEAIIKRPSD